MSRGLGLARSSDLRLHVLQLITTVDGRAANVLHVLLDLAGLLVQQSHFLLTSRVTCTLY